MQKPTGEDVLEREDDGDVTVVRLKVPRMFDDPTTEAAFDHLFGLVEENGRNKLVLDLSAIEFFASAALGKLVTLTRKTRAADGRVVLCNVTPHVEHVLQVSRLSDLLVAYNSEKEARKSFA